MWIKTVATSGPTLCYGLQYLSRRPGLNPVPEPSAKCLVVLRQEVSEPDVEHTLLAFGGLLLLGATVGAYGTLIGVGGGFVLLPFLLWLYPNDPSQVVASISLAVVFFNAFSGTAAYARMRRVDFRSGLMFASAALPGTVLGALSTSLIPRILFDYIVGGLLVIAAFWLLIQGRPAPEMQQEFSGGRFHTTLTDRSGNTYSYSFNPWLGVGISIMVGFISGMLGIGGGIIHVPALVHLLNFPVHVATATSHFILAIISLSGTITHLATGSLNHGIRRIIPLALGALIGAQFGARLSNRLHGQWIIRGLAIALFFVGLHTIWIAVP